MEAAGYKSDDATNHKWRHSFASNLIRSGVGPKIVQQLMRHEDVRQTLDTYSHLLQDDLEKALNKK
ncbi:tyrosine-type recombinase/integrase [Fibrobacter sp. UWOV1]|uniref:tyrosine-type recombinase/integrase n=1 Tax=Fibrobacter sp. UWOV1 TaxID=1896215 RepID=UPI0009FB5997|nr:tyrosine-type recombinase/integrase [Fibrobacter sp. UWOV1]